MAGPSSAPTWTRWRRRRPTTFRWLDRLGGADVFTLPNAWAMAESLRLDYNSLGPFSIKP